MVARTKYSIALELWNSNEYVARDFSVVAWSDSGPVQFTHNQGLESDHYWADS